LRDDFHVVELELDGLTRRIAPMSPRFVDRLPLRRLSRGLFFRTGRSIPHSDERIILQLERLEEIEAAGNLLSLGAPLPALAVAAPLPAALDTEFAPVAVANGEARAAVERTDTDMVDHFFTELASFDETSRDSLFSAPTTPENAKAASESLVFASSRSTEGDDAFTNADAATRNTSLARPQSPEQPGGPNPAGANGALSGAFTAGGPSTPANTGAGGAGSSSSGAGNGSTGQLSALGLQGVFSSAPSITKTAATVNVAAAPSPILRSTNLAAVTVSQIASPAPAETTATTPTVNAGQLAKAYGQMPLAFEANQGQADPAAQFLARGQGYGIFLTPTSAVLTLHQSSVGANTSASSPPSWNVLGLQLVGSDPNAQASGLSQLPGTSNYFVGSDPTQWHTNLANYASVQYHNVYQGIDLLYSGTSQHQLETTFVVNPGADPHAIQMTFPGTTGISLDARGNLILHTASGDVTQQAPGAYQLNADGSRTPVSSQFVRQANGQVGFRVGAYDPSKVLYIDPTVVYSTYLGGSGTDSGQSIAVDRFGNAYLVGTTASPDFPLANPGQSQPPVHQSLFVTKFSPAGDRLIYSTYLGDTHPSGSGFDLGYGIAVDPSGAAYVTGQASDTSYPVTPGAIQPVLRGPTNAIVTKLAPTGNQLVYSTFLGGNGTDVGRSIALDNAGDAFVAGSTTSQNFPLINPVQSSLKGSQNAFVTELNPYGSGLAFSTYLGGSGSDQANGIALGSNGIIYVVGSTSSADFLTTSGAFQTTAGGNGDVFVTAFNPNGAGLFYSTYVGGTGADQGNGIAVDGSGWAYVTGSTASSDFPTANALFSTNTGGQDAFVTQLYPDGSTVGYSTYLGGMETTQEMVSPWTIRVGPTLLGQPARLTSPLRTLCMEVTRGARMLSFLN
jgi:hypothetical protein